VVRQNPASTGPASQKVEPYTPECLSSRLDSMNRAEAKLSRAAERWRQRDTELAEAIRDAQAADVPMRRIADILGFSTRQAVYDLLARSDREV
jgi:hypothetical protein